MSSQPPARAIAAPSVRPGVARHHVPCNACGSDARQPYCPENGLGLVQCQRCGLVYVSPRPEAQELYALYGETYFHNDESGKVGYTNYIRDEANIRRTFTGRLKRLMRHIPKPGRLLDVGCAAGFFLSVAHAHGWQVTGLDVSSFAVEYTRQQFGFDARLGSLTDTPFDPESFDLITLWDVIEHVPDPKAYLAAAARLLPSGGVLALATPDVDSLPARLTGARWVGYKLSDEHIFYFSRTTLTRMLNEAGFDVIEARHVGKFVTLRLFIDRLGMYAPALAGVLAALERAFSLSERSLYVNPYDIISITARKR